MNKQEISLEEFKERVYGWLFHHTSLSPHKWRIADVAFRREYSNGGDPEFVALAIIEASDNLPI